MKLILKYFRPYLLFVMAAPLLMLLEVFMDLMQPTLMARIIDNGLIAEDLTIILHTGGRMLIVAVIGLFGGAGCTIFATYASTGLGARLRNDLFSQIQALSFKDLDSLKTGNLITILTNDVMQLENTSRMMLRIMIRAPLQVFGSLIFAILISPSLSLVLVVMVPLLIAGLVLIIRRAYPVFSLVQSRLDTINIRVQENLAAKRLVKAFVRETFEKEKFRQDNHNLADTMVRANRVLAFIHPFMQIILSLGIVVVLWAGGFLVASSGLEIGKLVAFINYLTQLLWSLMMISNLLMRISRAQVSAIRIEEVLNRRPVIREKPRAVTLAGVKERLEFRNVSFSYTGEKGEPALSAISFGIETGQTLAIMGATGSGKTTLVNLIPRFYDVSAGGILLDGTDIRDLSLVSLRRNIAMVMQETILFRGSVRRNILFGLEHCGDDQLQPEQEQRMKQAAETAMIAPFIDSLSERYAADISQKGLNLSGGQKQRLAIARALATDAPVLILDDSTSAVDAATELQIREALDRDPLARIRIIITQRISSVLDADKILLLEKGRVAGCGMHQQLLQQNGLYRDIYSSQYGAAGGGNGS